MMHELKTWPEPFQATWENRKVHEIRVNDRAFFTGDQLMLKEWLPDEKRYTGREIYAEVKYVSREPDWGLPQDLVVMSIRRIENIAGSPKP